MAIERRKYGTASFFKTVLITRGSQDFEAAPNIATGDVKISVDGGGENNLAVLPTCPNADTNVLGLLSAGELTGKEVVVTFIWDPAVHGGNPKEWEDQKLTFQTYGHPSAMEPYDYSSSTVVLSPVTHTGAVIPTVTNVSNDVGITQGGADKVWNSTTRTLTALGSGLVAEIWNALLTGMSTVGSVGYKLRTWLLGTDGGALLSGSTSQPPGVVIPTVTTVSNGVTLDQSQLIAPVPVPGSVGDALSKSVTNLDATMLSRASQTDVTILKNALTPRTAAVNDPTPTATTFITSLVEVPIDFWKDALLVFTSGALSGQARVVNAYNGSTKAVTVDALSTAPGNGDTFTIVSSGIVLGAALGVVWDAMRSGHSIPGSFGEAVRRVELADNMKLTADGMDAVFLETGLNLRQGLAVIAAALAGQLSGAGTSQIFIKAANNPSQNRIEAQVDSLGNRITLTLTLPA